MGRLCAQKRLTPWLEICHRVVAQFFQYSRMSPSDLGDFVCVKREAAADGAGGGSAAAGSPVTAGWLGKGCGTRGVHALRLLQRAIQSGKKRRAWEVPRRDMTYRLCHVDGCQCQPGALVSDSAHCLGSVFISSSLSILKLVKASLLISQ